MALPSARASSLSLPVIAEVETRLPDDFPERIRAAIFAGLRSQAARLP
ncbi:hypothetical protein [Brenneria roseae]|nr:hypothetical protein [Brenneria roseae]